ncbi:Crp/Fnr family transcriptional regulator [uncultured Tateyamaria sp.]|uniref:Crp/Fnr family transcriptional regulator n=1 Tax=uncultured Tateyamaria sp. TaxID=455651 RepID=UPI00262C39AC|nr:Crp/Fnr family transcriptional regulator [uncultured Tateyamaria sp.]
MSDHWLNCFDGAPERTLDEGETLFRRDDEVEWAFLVREGQISLRRALKDGGLLTLHTARPAELVAEASLYAHCYHCDAVAEVPTTVSLASKTELMGNLENAATSERALVKAFEHTARELQNLRTRVEIMRLRKVTDRLDAYLEFFDHPEEGEWVRVADWIGVTPPALYRELAKRRPQ